ncbi:MAG: thermonuclease family protein [Chloroflexi bacterium]|nr:thermonuclease family protein [Chloroflexota bacterium]
MATATPTLEPCAPTPREMIVPVERVIDGDTFVVTHDGRSERVRLLDVWAPELNEPGGDFAKSFAQSLVDGHWVRLVITAEGNGRDSFGRFLAHVYLADARHVSALIVGRTDATATKDG